MEKQSAARQFIEFISVAALGFLFVAQPAIADAERMSICGGNQSVRMRMMAPDAASFSFNPYQYFAIDDGVVGFEDLSRLTIVNTGSNSVTIGTPTLLQGNFTARFDMTQPVTLAPLDSMELRVYVTPQSAGALSGTVRYGLSTADTPYLDLAVQGNAINLQ